MQRVDLRGYEAATEQRCPVCGTESALSIRGSSSIACRKCAFVGDIIHLYASAKRIALAEAITELKFHGLVEFSSDLEETFYTSDAQEQATLQLIWAGAQETMASQTTVPRALLVNNLAWYGMETAKKASRYVGALHPKRFEEFDFDLPKEAKEAKAWWGHSMALAIPTYVGWRITGFHLIRQHEPTDQGVTPIEMFLPVVSSADNGVGFAHGVPVGTPEVVVADSALVALRYNVRQLFDGDLETPFVAPAHRRHVDLGCIGESAPIFFTATLSPEWFFRATEVPSARIIYFANYDDLGFTPTQTLAPRSIVGAASRTTLINLKNRARGSHEAYARFLLSRKPGEAKRIFAEFSLSPVGQSRCFQALNGEDATLLSRIFERGTHIKTVDVDGKVVTERDEGWFCGDTLVTDATFQITEILISGSATTARGYTRFRRQSVPFECSYDEIRRNTWNWLEDTVMSRPGAGVPMVNSAWRSRLLRIASGFQEPRRIVQGASYGWSDSGRALVMPYFVVRADGITGTEQATMGGPMLPRPAPLCPEEWGVIQDPQACQILLALMGNLLRTQAGLPGYGLAVRAAPHVVETVASALRVPVVRDPRPDRLERDALSPVPTPVIWTDDGLAEAFLSGVPMHVLMSADPGSHRILRLHKNWLCLDAVDFSWGPTIRFVFLMLRDLLWAPGPQEIRLDAENIYGDIARRLRAALVPRGIAGDVFDVAARELGKSVNHAGNAGFTLLLTLQWAQERGTLHPAKRDDLVILQVAEVRAALAHPLTPKADLEVLARQLVAARFLTLNRGGEWGIPEAVWNAAASHYAGNQA